MGTLLLDASCANHKTQNRRRAHPGAVRWNFRGSEHFGPDHDHIFKSDPARRINPAFKVGGF
jgi:hypothetical protein